MPSQLRAEFLQRHRPFSVLNAADLKNLSRSAELEYFRRGEEAPGLERVLYVIEKGGIALGAADGGTPDGPADLLTEGECFGFVLPENPAGWRARAQVDTICLVFPRAVIEELARQPEFAAALRGNVSPRWRAPVDATGLPLAGSADLPFITRVGAIVTRPLVSTTPETSIQQAAMRMRDEKVSALVICRSTQDLAGAGIVTNDDLRSRVVAAGASLDGPIAGVMSTPLRTIPGETFVFEALLQMIREGVNCLPVTAGGKIIGVVTGADIMRLQGHAPMLLARDVARRESPRELAETVGRLAEHIPFLVREGARPSTIGRIASGIYDRVAQRLLELVAPRLGEAPVAYCWVVMGSEGREEQTFLTDQDNGLIYADPPDEVRRAAAREYFSRLAEQMVQALMECGFPPCPGNYMASNPLWCRSVSEWQEAFARWIGSPAPDDVLNASIFLDLRAVSGDAGLAAAVLDFAHQRAQNSAPFLNGLVALATNHVPPLGFLGGFVVERSGPHRHELDLKLRGTMAIIDIARIRSLEAGVRVTSTFDRLQQLVTAGRINPADAAELADTLECLLSLRLRHQVEQRSAGLAPDNYLNPSRLSSVERATLREAFRVIERHQASLNLQFPNARRS